MDHLYVQRLLYHENRSKLNLYCNKLPLKPEFHPESYLICKQQMDHPFCYCFFSTTIQCLSTFSSITIRSSLMITVSPRSQVESRSHVLQPDPAITNSDHYEWSWDSSMLFKKKLTAILIDNINLALASALAIINMLIKWYSN